MASRGVREQAALSVHLLLSFLLVAYSIVGLLSWLQGREFFFLHETGVELLIAIVGILLLRKAVVHRGSLWGGHLFLGVVLLLLGLFPFFLLHGGNVFAVFLVVQPPFFLLLAVLFFSSLYLLFDAFFSMKRE